MTLEQLPNTKNLLCNNKGNYKPENGWPGSVKNVYFWSLINTTEDRLSFHCPKVDLVCIWIRSWILTFNHFGICTPHNKNYAWIQHTDVFFGKFIPVSIINKTMRTTGYPLCLTFGQGMPNHFVNAKVEPTLVDTLMHSAPSASTTCKSQVSVAGS